MTQKTDFSWRTFTMKRRHSVPARAAVETRLTGAIVDIPFAIPAFPSIHASAQEPAVHVVTSGPVLANVGMIDTFVNVHFTKTTYNHFHFKILFKIITIENFINTTPTFIIRGTFASVIVHSVDTSCVVFARIPNAIVDIHFAISSRKSRRTLAIIL